MTNHHAVPPVAVGQVWADNDKRAQGRTLRVNKLEEGPIPMRRGFGAPEVTTYAVCTILTDRTGQVDLLGSVDHRTAVGRTVRIRVDRMKPTATGYRFVSYPQE